MFAPDGSLTVNKVDSHKPTVNISKSRDGCLGPSDPDHQIRNRIIVLSIAGRDCTENSGVNANNSPRSAHRLFNPLDRPVTIVIPIQIARCIQKSLGAKGTILLSSGKTRGWVLWPGMELGMEAGGGSACSSPP